MDVQPVRIQAAGQRYWAGDMRAINTTLPLATVVRLSADQAIWRQDFELDSKKPGNRPVDLGHVERIKQAIKENAEHLMLGAAILAVDPDAIQVDAEWPVAEQGKLVDIRVFGLKAGYDMFTIDFQHRREALVRLYDELARSVGDGLVENAQLERLFQKSSIPVIIALERDPAIITHMFVGLAQAKPITPSLVVAMDRFDPSNKLALMVARRWNLLNRERGRPASGLEYLSGAPRGQTLYSAAALRAAAATVLIGFRDRTPQQRNTNLVAELRSLYGRADDAALRRAADWIVEQFNLAAERMPGWRDLLKADEEHYPDALADFKRSSLLRSSGGLSVVAGVIAAARVAELDAKKIISEMADASQISWRREDVRHDKDPETDLPRARHRTFEGLLTKTAMQDDGTGHYHTVYRTAGGTRSQYEPATRKVIEIIARDKTYKSLASREVLAKLGLEAEAQRGRGRPRKVFQPNLPL